MLESGVALPKDDVTTEATATREAGAEEAKGAATVAADGIAAETQTSGQPSNGSPTAAQQPTQLHPPSPPATEQVGGISLLRPDAPVFTPSFSFAAMAAKPAAPPSIIAMHPTASVSAKKASAVDAVGGHSQVKLTIQRGSILRTAVLCHANAKPKPKPKLKPKLLP